MKKKIKIAVTGAYGRMGTSIIQEIQKNKNVILQCCIVKEKKQEITIENNKNTKIINNIEQEIKNFDILIDFSTPDNTLNNLKICKKYKKNIVIGTTGFSKQEIQIIKQYSQYIGIVFSYNFSIGINIIFKILKQSIQMFDDSYDIEILELHHRNKIDSPSGTALKLGEIITNNKQWNLETCSIYRKKEKTNIRASNKIGFSIIRGGDIIGEHTIMFLGSGEKITISHQATNRNTFAQGAIKSAIWLNNKQDGLFDMLDVLNI